MPQIVAVNYDGHDGREILTVQQTKFTFGNKASLERRSTAILAQLTDYTGLVKEQDPPRWVYGHLQNVKILSPLLNAGTHERMGTYWQRLALLVMGNSGLRVLPYSDEYGTRHSNPTPVRKASRYGYFDVDIIDKLPALPRWRAWLMFRVLHFKP
jgi:hypothetical protein